MQITIYSTTTCPYCKMLKDYLTSKNIVYTEKLIDVNESAQKEMAEVSGGFMGVPFSYIKKDDDTSETVLGFDQRKIDSILNV